MPLSLINQFRSRSIQLMMELNEAIEVRFPYMSNEEKNYFKTLQLCKSDQERFDSLCEAFGKLMFMHTIIGSKKSSNYKKGTKENG